MKVLSRALLAVGATAALSLPLFAQSDRTDTLSTLLSEVRQLRIAMERSASIAPQVQLLGARLTVQNERLSRATSDHQSVQDEIDRLAASVARMSANVQETESAASAATDPAIQRQLAMDLRSLKPELESQTAMETRLRAREVDLANAVASEQARWLELNARLDELERALATPRR